MKIKNLIIGLIFCHINVAGAFEKSNILKDNKIEIRPIAIQGDEILVPAKKNEGKIEKTYLAGYEQVPLELKLVKNKPEMIKTFYDGEMFWRFALPKATISFHKPIFALLGSNTPKVVEFSSVAYLSNGGIIPDCALPEPGYITASIDYRHFKSKKEKKEIDFFYTTSWLLESKYKKMSETEKSSGIWHKERLDWVVGENCNNLAFTTSDGDGLNNKGDSEPLGEILGVLELSDGSKPKEFWLTVKGHGYETYGLTFVRVPDKFGEKSQKVFILSHGL